MAGSHVPGHDIFYFHNYSSLFVDDCLYTKETGAASGTARKLNPQVRIIASSGLTESIDAADLDQLGVKIFLTKPYDAKTLLKTVAQALSLGAFAS